MMEEFASSSLPKLAFVRLRLLDFVVLLDRDDDIALFVSLLDIPVSLDNVFQRIASIYEWFYLSRFNQHFVSALDLTFSQKMQG